MILVYIFMEKKLLWHEELILMVTIYFVLINLLLIITMKETMVKSIGLITTLIYVITFHFLE